MNDKINYFILKIYVFITIKLRARFSHRKDYFLNWGTNSFITSTIYYTLFDDSFDNEHFRILNGKYNFKTNNGSLGIYSKIRRNIHRLEKGIAASYLSSRDVFAKEYIEETIDGIDDLLGSNYINTPFHKWSFDVIDKYFTIIQVDEHLEILNNKWNLIVEKYPIEANLKIQHIPYEHSKLEVSDVSFEDLNTLFRRRRSVRWYNNRKVDSQLIRKAVESSLTAPSACNRQPFQVFFIEGEKLNEMKELKLGFESYSDCIQSFIFIVGDLSAYMESRDKHLIYIDGSLFAMSFMLVLETLGISSCPINFPDMAWLDRKVQDILHLEDYQKGIMLISLGYADGDSPIPYSAKKEVNEIFKIIS